ncbi:MAG: SMC-Scp complex subunit ScpB [Actinomycetota bacterium]
MTDALRAEKVIEAVLFVADDPVPTADLALLLEVPAHDVVEILSNMAESFYADDRGIVLREVAGGWRLATSADTAPYLERFVNDQKSFRISPAALETLAIIAYRQPISRSQLTEIRGVNCDRVVRSLMIQGVVEQASEDTGPGRAILYGTTPDFLEKVGLNSLSDLPELSNFMPDTKAVERMETGLGPGL